VRLLVACFRVCAAVGSLVCRSGCRTHRVSKPFCRWQKVVYDCPVKTRHDTLYALEKAVNMNVDNFQELERVDRYVQERGDPSTHGGGVLGVRINPQVRSLLAVDCARVRLFTLPFFFWLCGVVCVARLVPAQSLRMPPPLLQASLELGWRIAATLCSPLTSIARG